MNFVWKVYVTLRAVVNHPLRRGSKWRTGFDYGLAQVAARLVPGDIRVPFPNQTSLLIPPRMKGAAHFIIPGLCEFEEMAFAMHFLRPEDLFVDVGANIGAYSVLASAAAGSRTIAYEPGARAFRYLLENIKLNELQTRVSARQEAVGAKEGHAHLTDELGTENFVCEGTSTRGAHEVPMTTLDKALAGMNPTVIKVDVEGFENEVFAGAQNVLTSSGLSVLIVERVGNAGRYGYDEAALHERIQQRGFVPCAYEPFQRALRRLPANAQGNLIYVRDMPAAQERLKQARPFRFADRAI